MIRTVLCPVDFSSISSRELRLAARLCERFRARLVLQHGIAGEIPPLLGVSWMHAEEHRAAEEAEAAEGRGRLQELLGGVGGAVKAEGMLTRGPLDRSVLKLAAVLPADLIVLGTHGRSGVEHRSLADRVILDASCPVLATRDDTPEEPFPSTAGGGLDTIRTIVAVDFSAHSRRALDYAIALLQWLPLQLHLVHVDPGGVEDEGEALERLRGQLPAALRDRIEVEMRRGNVSREILRGKTDFRASLIVMGTHHKALLTRLLDGSTARELLHRSFCPVWFVPEGTTVPAAA